MQMTATVKGLREGPDGLVQVDLYIEPTEASPAARTLILLPEAAAADLRYGTRVRVTIEAEAPESAAAQ